MSKPDFTGIASKSNMRCSDGRIILPQAFKDDHGRKVPLVWNHRHDCASQVLGHGIIEHRDGDTWISATFNDTNGAKVAKELLKHGDVDALSICATNVIENNKVVSYGKIKEVSLVFSGANPGAVINQVMLHGDEAIDEFYIVCGEKIEFEHSDKKKKDPEENPKTVQEVIDSMTKEQQDLFYNMMGYVKQQTIEEMEDEMKHNAFSDVDTMTGSETVTFNHEDQTKVINMAKETGSFRQAMAKFTAENDIEHAFSTSDTVALFPDYQLTRPGAPELVTRDRTWVDSILSGASKSPYSRIRTRQADARLAELRASGYSKRQNKKKELGNLKLITRTTDPQTIYVRDGIHRDDLIDIVDFDVVNYQFDYMRKMLEEELAVAILIGDGRDTGDADKIAEEHIRPIWTDDDVYTIKEKIDLDAMKASLQGTNTAANFGDNFVFAEAVITAALNARIDYRGSGSLTFYCSPHALNKMLLARDLNGRRIYSSKDDLKAALNVNDIMTVEQFQGRKRTVAPDDVRELVGIFVNMKDYKIGATKGGEITRFNQFDIDFNKEKYLLETRVSGALENILSAIAIEVKSA